MVGSSSKTVFKFFLLGVNILIRLGYSIIAHFKIFIVWWYLNV